MLTYPQSSHQQSQIPSEVTTASSWMQTSHRSHGISQHQTPIPRGNGLRGQGSPIASGNLSGCFEGMR